MTSRERARARGARVSRHLIAIKQKRTPRIPEFRQDRAKDAAIREEVLSGK